MPVANLKYLTTILAFNTVIVAVHNNVLFKMIALNEDLRKFAIPLKGSERFDYNKIETFIISVMRIKLSARDLEADISATSWEVFKNISRSLSAKMPNNPYLPKEIGWPTNELYSSDTLESLDEHRRIFLKSASDYLGRDANIVRLYCNDIMQLVNTNLGEKTITVSHVCSSLNSCANVARPFTPTQGQSLNRDEKMTSACTADRTCDVENALPLMTGLFYSKVSETATNYGCCQVRSSENVCENYAQSSKELKHEADVLVAYAYSHPEFWTIHWNSFFTDAISSNAHLDIKVAFSMMEEKKSDFEILRVACRILQFTKACDFYDIYKQYLVVKKSQQIRSNPTHVKDLRRNQQMNHAKLVELQKIKLDHLKILDTVTDLDDDLQVSIEGISTFFRQLAKFDQGIADADAAFISSELDKYNTTLMKVQDKLMDDFHEAMSYMMDVITSKLVRKIALLGMKMATNCNPIKLLFTGPNIVDIATLANEVADAGVDVSIASALIHSLTELADDSDTFANALPNSCRRSIALKSKSWQVRLIISTKMLMNSWNNIPPTHRRLIDRVWLETMLCGRPLKTLRAICCLLNLGLFPRFQRV